MKRLLAKCNYDLLNCTWAHAVNSRNALLEILQSDIHCIESDVMYNYDDGLAYMSHPPICKTDFKFIDYWDLCKSSDKIFKLDFKMIESVNLCLNIIDKQDMDKVIVNADILATHNSLSQPVDCDRFIDSCVNASNGVAMMLSIGWTTMRQNEIGYKWTDVYEMMKIVLDKLKISNAFQMITLPIDVHMLSLDSIPKLLWLLEQFPDQELSLTIWSYKNVPIDINCLLLIRKLLKKSSIFVDIPDLTVSEKKLLLSTPADSIHFTSNVEIAAQGKMLYQSCNSFIIGDETHVDLRKKFDDKLEFFLVFAVLDVEAINTEPLSDCKLYFRLSSSSSDQNQFMLFRKDAIFYHFGSTNELVHKCDKSIEEFVYFCSISRHESFCQLDIGPVNGYNKASMNWTSITSLRIDIEREIRISLKTNRSDCRFVVIDFLNEFSSRPVKLI